MNYSRNRKYFQPTSVLGPVLMLVCGVWLALPGFGWLQEGGWVLVLLGVAMIAGAILILRNISRGRVSDEEIDKVVGDYAEQVRETALKKLNVDPSEVSSVDPLIVLGYDFNDATRIKRGKDLKYRTNVAELVVIWFADDVLHAYKEHFSLTSRNFAGNETHTYFYKDVVSISTTQGKVNAKLAKGGKVTYDEFRLTTSGGTTVGCSILNENLSERSIQGARTLVMERKRS